MAWLRRKKDDDPKPTPEEQTPLRSEEQNGYQGTGNNIQEPASLEAAQKAPAPVSWASMPRKWQLAVIVFARLAEPLSERSLTSYLFYQLRWFDPSLEPSEIAKQAGHLTAVFAAAQCLTSMWWGRVADTALFGRKRVLIIGLFGSAMCALGMGFSPSFTSAMFFRFFSGALNGNIGVLRTMVSEIVPDKRYKARAFLILPMCFNVGVIIGPLMSGFLADPIHSLPSIFGPGSIIGGRDGVAWMKQFPYALPNVVCASVLLAAAFCIILGLDETHPMRRDKLDPGRELGKFIVRKVLRQEKGQDYEYEPIPSSANTAPSTSQPVIAREPEPVKKQARFRDMFTRNVCFTLLQHFLRALHGSAFNTVFFSLLPTPRYDNSHASLPFRFSGGLGLSSKSMGLVNTILGSIGIPLQILLYPVLSARLGILASYRMFLPLSIAAYFLIPYLVLLPDNMAVIWTCLTALLSLQVLARVFITPASMILVNESAPSPTLLGTVHGFASSISSFARIFGPSIGGSALGWGLAHNFVGFPLWGMGVIGLANWSVLWFVEEAAVF
ncbi:unnamed protein product [Clonostachys byssicola]|uniref:Major facilitator superfamily (MFS) profile domain-containing protein n=1 Tax=Clonostachys byssicola TaxID=160290 RepID=A0A9N9XZN5_9HYPO|nr:unnamed protein product [Clonostachys byssicola]